MTEPDVGALLTVGQAIDILDTVPVEPGVRIMSLHDAFGYRLAQDLAADRDYPPFRKSLMDGFAVRIADLAAAPVELKVVGEVAAGGSTDRELGPSEAIAIMTGAPVPPGADGVVPVEDTEKIGTGDERSVRILQAGTPSRHIAARGSDCPAGKVVLRRGTLLGPAQIAVAASIGAARLEVFVPPRVAVLGTGDELVAVDAQPGPSQIRNSNSPMLVALLRRMGCEVTDLGMVPDRPDTIRAALQSGLSFDALFVSGGMSMGEYDYVPRLLQEMGVQLKITKLRIKPGKPFVFGIAENPGFGQETANNQAESLMSVSAGPSATHPRFVFGLPGNPVSAYVCTLRLASRLLTRMGGGVVEERWLTGMLDAGLPMNGPREFYQPAIRTVTRGKRSAQAAFAAVTPLAWKGSADLYTLATANVLLVRAENEPPVPKGTIVRVLEL